MTDDATERLIRETLARCVPDEERRKAILARVRLRELLEDPEVVAAQQVLDSATPDELDQAFALALQRGTFDALPPAVAVEPPLTAWERLKFAARATAAGLGSTVDQIAGVSVSRLRLAGGTLGHEAAPVTADTERLSFSFPLPSDLGGTNGLPINGEAEIADGVLNIFVNRTSGVAGPRLAVVAVADGQIGERVRLQPDPEYPRLLAASVEWRFPTVPTDLVIAVVDEP